MKQMAGQESNLSRPPILLLGICIRLVLSLQGNGLHHCGITPQYFAQLHVTNNQ